MASYIEQTGTRNDNSAIDSSKVLSELSKGKFAINTSFSVYMPEKYTISYINSLFTAKDQIEEFWNSCVSLASSYIDKFENAPYPDTISPDTAFLEGFELGEKEQLGYIISDNVNLYSKPNGDTIGNVAVGSAVVAMARTSDSQWIKIRTKDGTVAYIPQNGIGNKRDIPKGTISTNENSKEPNALNTQQNTATPLGEVRPGVGLTDGDYGGMKYYLYEPNLDGNPKSLTIFLHGSGEDGGKLSKAAGYGIGANLKAGKDYDGYVLVPHSNGSWDTKKLNELIDEVSAKYNIDKNKISIAGYSKGASAMAKLLKENPNKFSAAAFIGSSVDDSETAKVVANMPTRFLSGRKNPSATDASESMVNKIQKAGGSSATMDVYDGYGHNNPFVTMLYNEGGLYDWLTSQSRAKSV